MAQVRAIWKVRNRVLLEGSYRLEGYHRCRVRLRLSQFCESFVPLQRLTAGQDDERRRDLHCCFLGARRCQICTRLRRWQHAAQSRSTADCCCLQPQRNHECAWQEGYYPSSSMWHTVDPWIVPSVNTTNGSLPPGVCPVSSASSCAPLTPSRCRAATQHAAK